MKAASGSSAGRDVFYALGEVKSTKRETDEAAKWYEKASAADPSWGKPLYKLGVLALNKGDTPERHEAVRSRDCRRSDFSGSGPGESVP